MKVSDYGKLIVVLHELMIPFKEWDDEIYIDEASVKVGAVKSVSIRESVHIQFNEDGDCISTCTDSMNSTIFRHKKSRKKK